MTADWTQRASQQWTVPVGGGGGKLWRVGSIGLPVNTQIQTGPGLPPVVFGAGIN